MKEWLAENWPYLVMAIIYVAERSQALTAARANMIRKLVTIIRGKDIGVVRPDKSATKDAMIDANLYHAPEIDKALDIVQPEEQPRVSKGKKVVNTLLQVLPVVSRFMK